MIGAVLDHLWQSTLFAGIAGLLTLMLRRNGAHIRFLLWFAASVKFLIPFAAIAALGSYFLPPFAPRIFAPALSMLLPAAQPFSSPSALPSALAAQALDLTPLLLTVWGIGFALIGGRWWSRWLRVRRALHEAVDSPLAAPVAVRMSPESLEPGLVGIVRPVILLPEGITKDLSGAEIDAILAHEMCHVNRRDNLGAASHMLVETLFWFHPLVWWLGARLNEERERACDEGVLASGKAPQIYAESILKVCRLYLHSPLACAAGISGTDLKRRLEAIVENRSVLRLNPTQKLTLLGAAILAVAAPLTLDLLASQSALAQTASPAIQSRELTAELRAEQSLPRKRIAPFDAGIFDRYVGFYQFSPTIICTVTRDGGHFLARLTGQAAVEVFPESDTKFFIAVIPAQISFNTDAKGRVAELVLHQNGLEQHAPRIDEAVAKRLEAALAQRIKGNVPSRGTEAAVRTQIEGLETGQADFNALTPPLAAAAREQWPVMQPAISSLGAVKSIAFKSVDGIGQDIYEVVFERGHTEWTIAPLTGDGRISSISWRRVP